ncbi:hypothetical protein BD779DRAFT_791854 [Infundibulicybe gibba]|nr:hypothetical protein BD779DRAFT_791854 [Infundibulicybe gibba]
MRGYQHMSVRLCCGSFFYILWCESSVKARPRQPGPCEVYNMTNGHNHEPRSTPWPIEPRAASHTSVCLRKEDIEAESEGQDAPSMYQAWGWALVSASCNRRPAHKTRHSPYSQSVDQRAHPDSQRVPQ